MFVKRAVDEERKMYKGIHGEQGHEGEQEDG
jgi:hypothetical protein